METCDRYGYVGRASDWIWLVFAHPFALNNGAPVASANFISDGKVQVSPYLAYHFDFGSKIQYVLSTKLHHTHS